MSGLGNIHITKNLSEALPHLIEQSCTQLLWIDQICIDQKNEQERGHQVKLMRDIYKGACTTLIWLNPHHTDFETAGEHGRLALRTLEASIGKLGSTYFHAVPFRKILGGFRVDLEDRVLAHMVDLRRLLSPELKKALTEVLQRPWFSRGWIVQEFVFSRNPIFILHNQTMRNAQLEGLVSLAYAIGMTDLSGEVGATVKSLRELRAMLKEEQPPRWMVLLWTLNTFGESYGTAELRDGIFAYLGIWKPNDFEPDYGKHIERIFQDFIMHIAQETKSLEFLGSVAMDCEHIFTQLSSLPSWVPDWTARVQEPSTVWLYFSADYGESRTRRWNACRSRKHFHSVPIIGSQMIVRGKIFDQGEAVSDKRISEYITDRGFQHITTTKRRACSLLHGLMRLDILNAIWGLIITPDRPNEARRRDPFGRKLQALSPKEVLDHLDNRWHIQDGYRAHPGTPMWDKDAMVESLLKTVCCRRLMATTGGRIAWVRSCCEEGDVVAIIHGCSVPMVLRKTDEPGCTYEVVGDCYIDGMMDGEAVDWGELDADEIVLV